MTIKIDREGPVALHHQLRALLLEQIKQGRLPPGSKVPAESELIAQFGVSRTTVRQAIGDLVQQGLVYRVQGSGTFVTHKLVPQNLHHLTSFSEDMRAYGRSPASVLLFLGIVDPDPQVAEALKSERPVTKIERIRLDEDRPIEIQTSFVTTRYRIDPASFTSTSSLYDLLARNYGVQLTAADETLEAVGASPIEAELLGLQAGEPILRVERITYNELEQPIEFVVRRYRTDEYKYYVRLTRRPKG